MKTKLKTIKHDVVGDVMSATLLLNGELFTVLKVGTKYRVTLCRLDTSGLIWRFTKQDLKTQAKRRRLKKPLESEALAEFPICVYDFLVDAEVATMTAAELGEAEGNNV